MEQKVLQIGNSIGVVIPRAIQKGAPLKPGDKIIVEKDPLSDTYLVRKKGEKGLSVTPGFLQILQNVNKHYSKALKELAKK